MGDSLGWSHLLAINRQISLYNSKGDIWELRQYSLLYKIADKRYIVCVKSVIE